MRTLWILLAFMYFPFSGITQINYVEHNKAVEKLNLAKELMAQESYAEAIQHLKSAVELDSSMRASYMLIYEAGYVSGNTQVARDYLEKAKTIFLEDDEVIYYLAKVYQKEKNYLAALGEFTLAIKYSKVNGEDLPIIYDYYASRGVCYLKQNKYQKALDDFNDALKLNEMEGSIYVNRGYALYKLEQHDAGCKSWQKAFDLGHTYVQKYLDKFCK